MVVERVDHELALRFAAESHDVELKIATDRVHLAVAGHDLEVVSQNLLALRAGLREVDHLVVDNAVRDALRVQEAPVHKQIEESSANDATKLVVANLCHFGELLLSFASDVLAQLFGCLVLVSPNFVALYL